MSWNVNWGAGESSESRSEPRSEGVQGIIAKCSLAIEAMRQTQLDSFISEKVASIYSEAEMLLLPQEPYSSSPIASEIRDAILRELFRMEVELAEQGREAERVKRDCI